MKFEGVFLPLEAKSDAGLGGIERDVDHAGISIIIVDLPFRFFQQRQLVVNLPFHHEIKVSISQNLHEIKVDGIEVLHDSKEKMNAIYRRISFKNCHGAGFLPWVISLLTPGKYRAGALPSRNLHRALPPVVVPPPGRPGAAVVFLKGSLAGVSGCFLFVPQSSRIAGIWLSPPLSDHYTKLNSHPAQNKWNE